MKIAAFPTPIPSQPATLPTAPPSRSFEDVLANAALVKQASGQPQIVRPSPSPDPVLHAPVFGHAGPPIRKPDPHPTGPQRETPDAEVAAQPLAPRAVAPVIDEPALTLAHSGVVFAQEPQLAPVRLGDAPHTNQVREASSVAPHGAPNTGPPAVQGPPGLPSLAGPPLASVTVPVPPTPPPVTARLSSDGAAKPPVMSLAAPLDEMGVKVTGQQQAFGFVELGVWGHGGQLSAPGESPIQIQEALVPMPSATVAAATLEAVAEPGLGVSLLIDPGDAALSVHPATDGPSGNAAEPDQASDPDVRAPSQEGAEITVLSRSDSSSQTRSARAMTMTMGGADARDVDQLVQRDFRAGNGLNVIVSESDGSIQVIAASQDLPPEAAGALRKAASDAVAELGLALTEFSLNGNVIKPRAGTIGASNGSRPG